jgi:hypothetical protein
MTKQKEMNDEDQQKKDEKLKKIFEDLGIEMTDYDEDNESLRKSINSSKRSPQNVFFQNK